jgi:predicted RNase H-like HicB family nuclease
MLHYKAAYRLQMGSFFAEVLDFPEASAFGATVDEARNHLLSALRYAAQRRLRHGELLPIPGPASGAADAYLVETVTLLPRGDDTVAVEVGLFAP